MANMADKIHPHWRSSFPKCNLSQLYCICMIENNISSLIQQIRTESEPQHQQLSNYFKTAITTDGQKRNSLLFVFPKMVENVPTRS